MTSLPLDHSFHTADEATYKRRIRAWTMYDWANSAFATTILAAVLPAYYSSVAGATLPSEATATAYWSVGLSISLFITALLTPILGTVSDVMRGKKKFLSVFAGFGIIATGLMVFIGTGDWLLASMLFILARIGFTGSIVFYDALLPHVAKPEDQDAVSTRGYAMGYLGGGLLLAINIVMIQVIPDFFEFAGLRLALFSVAIWWAVFSFPLFRHVPEPPAAGAKLKDGESIIGTSFKRIRETIRDIQRYRELFKYLIAFLIYNDAIGTIIGVAVIYGAELGFSTIELILALLLVQFAGIPFSLIFGQLPSKQATRRHFYLAFILFSLVALPVVGIFGKNILAQDVSGAPPDAYVTNNQFLGEGNYDVQGLNLDSSEIWANEVISGDVLAGEGFASALTVFLSGRPDDVTYAVSAEAGTRYDFQFNGQAVKITYQTGANHGIWAVEVDGEPYIDEDGEVEQIDTYNEVLRYGETTIIEFAEAGEHTLSLINTGESNADSNGTITALSQIEVLKPQRQSSLPLIIGILFAVQGAGLLFAFVFQNMFKSLAEKLNTQRSILLALVVYGVIALWGFFLDSTVEFWLLAWMVAIVQGGSQALSRSLYASMSPASKSGEFFGLYGVMEKFSAILGPLIFAVAVATFGNSRPAILSLIAFFIIGGFLLMRVDVAEGIRVAREEDASLLSDASV